MLLAAEVLEAEAALEHQHGREARAQLTEERAEALFQELHAEPWGRQIRSRTRQVAAMGHRREPGSAAPESPGA